MSRYDIAALLGGAVAITAGAALYDYRTGLIALGVLLLLAGIPSR